MRRRRRRAKGQPIGAEEYVTAEVIDETAEGGRDVTVRLDDPETLKQAMIYHEVLGPPKALRPESTGREQ